jgi:hypothetical protein
LDVFFAINETANAILLFNQNRFKDYKIIIKETILEDIINKDIKPLEEIYWNVWVKEPYNRGIPRQYNFQGTIILYFIVNAENCDPFHFETIIHWTYEKWDNPDIKVKKENIYINDEQEG